MSRHHSIIHPISFSQQKQSDNDKVDIMTEDIDLELVWQSLEKLHNLAELTVEQKKTHWKQLAQQEIVINRKLTEEKPPASVESYLKSLQTQGLYFKTMIPLENTHTHRASLSSLFAFTHIVSFMKASL
jgi:hypothetical protein